MFAPPPELQARVFAKLSPDMLAKGRTSEWFVGRPNDRQVPSFLEGPSFDREGHLYCVDIPWGRILKVSPQGEFSVFVEYDGEPNGLKIHKDGRIFVADQKNGIITIDPKTKEIKPFLQRAMLERLRGPNDMVFASNGDLYFTDQGQSGLHNPTGRVFRVRASGEVDLLLKDVPSPNGLVLNKAENVLFLAVTRTNSVWKVPMLPGGGVSKVGTYIQLSGGGGPDGLAQDEAGNLLVAHSGLGSVWVFDPHGEPIYRVKTCAGRSTTNIAYGGKDNKQLFMTESMSGSILVADMPEPGRPMYSHM
jgi:gluconolactonase